MTEHDIVVIGGGPAGMAAAAAAYEKGVKDVLIIERDDRLGGILKQCIHNGFGLHTFKEELTGPEYAERYIRQVKEYGIPYLTNTMVLDISGDRVITAVNSENGIIQIRAGAVILAMGCRERPRGALQIPGGRPAGIYSAGTAQYMVNIEGKMPGRRVVILGSGDIGLIMARRLTLEGAEVMAVVELMPYSGGLRRNIVQCLEDYDIPLMLSHTITNIKGTDRVEQVTVMEVDENRVPVPGTEWYCDCDTVLLSCGLIPENELSQQAGIRLNPVTNGPVVNEMFETGTPGIFACGNVLHVHDLVDYVSEEASKAGGYAAEYVTGREIKSGNRRNITCSGGIRYSVPSVISVENMDDELTVRFRVGQTFRNGSVVLSAGDEVILSRKRSIMVPGQMEQIVIKKSDLEKLSGDCSELQMYVEGGNE